MKITIPIIFAALLTCSACTKFLKEDIYTEYDPAQFANSVDGFEKVLNSAYAELQIRGYDHRNDVYCFGEFCTDVMLQTGGGFEAQAKEFITFTWNPTNGFLNTAWSKAYRAIRNSNVLLDNKDAATAIPPAKLNALVAEARFIRATAYAYLYNLFGPVPLITTAKNVDPGAFRATDEEMSTFIIDELKAAAGALPVQQSLRGKATRGAALGVLCKFYLNKKMWQACADVAEEIRALKAYSLFDDVSRLFAVENENNSEYIFAFPCIAQSGYGNITMAHTFPPAYPILPNWIIFGAQFRLYTSFVDSFEPADERLKMILREYTNTSGVTIRMNRNAAGAALNNARSFKYVPDPAGQSDAMGNDIPYIRYADILLALAESLNELNGPTQPAIDLVNEVRARASASLITLAGYGSREALRDFILAERAREFVGEGKRREDLIRMGQFISGAQARGMNAKPWHVLYPIPQREIEANKNLEQNEGYVQ
ncbi:RagB/SusD family nutrient uptake outer membrane protein [Chitinophaga sp.]|uniref:RagB/SusD family nutrient uptake outer membrane protein n=1 Tax=Chitinophaga sp. TaxID=1869181 RepID=UPI0031DC9471